MSTPYLSDKDRKERQYISGRRTRMKAMLEATRAKHIALITEAVRNGQKHLLTEEELKLISNR
jgi:hypothetical protein